MPIDPPAPSNIRPSAATVARSLRAETEAMAARTGQKSKHFDGEPAGPYRGVIAQFHEADRGRRLAWCPHLRPTGANTAFWLAYLPDKLQCRACAGQAERELGVLDVDCNACGSGEHTGSMTVAEVAPERSLPLGGARPATKMLVALCRICGIRSGIAPHAHPEAIR